VQTADAMHMIAEAITEIAIAALTLAALASNSFVI
jgi:hypothetical protein